ncbi:MAG TPA: toll/interleukin-1 receptor domain-containing protein [Ignavibacteria bacterium]|nr:toll/interleukin-1 receptor domain-containing protein [Ignavibacteria bacterium]HMR41186.1 toll/interleukin-1 receptor domain-containing protein [Ignavibacteria bacterium]
MKNRIKYPLSIYVVWHPEFKKGKEIANKLYSIFCRDIEEPLSRGLGIPVYYRSVTKDVTPISIDPKKATRNAIVLLIDQNYFIDENFKEYTKKLMKLVNASVRIFPVQLCEQATEFGQGINSIQFIRAYKGGLTSKEYKKSYRKNNFNLSDVKDFNLSMNKIKTELMHDCARLIMNFQPIWKDKEKDRINSPVKLFLSHAKKDSLKTAKPFKEFVDTELKLDVFFDTVDIADGYEFKKQIEENIKESAFVVFHTDEYSEREWCRIEVLIAKRNKCPIVVVHDIKSGERRAFPYLGNTPTITILKNKNEGFIRIVNLTLYQVLNNLYQRELLESIHKDFSIEGTLFVTITSPPELFNYIDIYKKKEKSKQSLVILYPEPPLGAEELKVLNEIDKEIKYITPILLPTLL